MLVEMFVRKGKAVSRWSYAALKEPCLPPMYGRKKSDEGRNGVRKSQMKEVDVNPRESPH
jgi:hypothetical protein